METIREEKAIEQDKSGVREWTEDDNKMGNMVDLYYKL